MPAWRRNVMQCLAFVGYRTGSEVTHPITYLTEVPMHLPGDRLWQGLQKDNCVTGLTYLSNYVGRNLYTTQQAGSMSPTVLKSDGNVPQGASMGPALLAAMRKAAYGAGGAR